jgi:hypothetical protein
VALHQAITKTKWRSMYEKDTLAIAYRIQLVTDSPSVGLTKSLRLSYHVIHDGDQP